MRRQKEIQTGQTLIEVLLAFSVSILVLSAIVIGITTSLSNTQYTRNQNSANSYAQEGISVVRQIRDSNWDKFRNFYVTDTYCLGQDSELITLTSLNCGKNVGIFSREVKLTHNSPNCCSRDGDPVFCASELKGSEATIKVSWSDNKCPTGADTPFCHEVELITCLSNIDQKQSP